MKSFIIFILFLLLVMGGGVAIGITTAPATWYESLQKPFFNPPNWVFGPVWTLLYLMIAFVGWRIWRRGDNLVIKRVWITQLCLNFLWSPVFFTAQMLGLAFGVITFLLITIILFIGITWRKDRLSAVLFIPYSLWVGFALVLNGAIFHLN